MVKRRATDKPEGALPVKRKSRTGTPASVPGPGHAVAPGASTRSKRRATEDPDGAKLPHAENTRRPASGFSLPLPHPPPPPAPAPAPSPYPTALTSLRDKGLVKRAEELVVAAQDCWRKGDDVAVARLADEIRLIKKIADTRTDLAKPKKTKVLGAFRQILTWKTGLSTVRPVRL
ncbi:hypothetical protein BZA05DRAFT_422082 [Tricharina praecox]|uniref:uncharacterized protein n=1 Tax=Tricharina praecox TaxID=43433 RepID=UPI00221F80DE|nr:uncharacterized protein BZA05DRAFT_422082 [Tricharina praecox]KAI5843767.1 hypothetical protein BZA05DRAFT_422082 [Tricharina praecox]